MSGITRLIKSFLPPIVFDLARRPFSHEPYGYSGNYRSWEEACKASEGYDSDIILARVRDSLLKVKTGQAVYERDSVLFDKVQYAWPLLAALLWAASCNGNRLKLIDFGGSLGSTYYQNRNFLQCLTELDWSIVEQEKFVACGRELFEDRHLKFYYDIEECCKERDPQVLLFSSVLQYLEKPYELLELIVSKKFPVIIFDRTSFLAEGPDRITVQKVPPEIYPASYPAWFFSKPKFLQFFSGCYELMADFSALAGYTDLGDAVATDEGLIFRLKQ